MMTIPIIQLLENRTMKTQKRKNLFETLVEKDPKNKETLEQLCTKSQDTKIAINSINRGYLGIKAYMQKAYISGMVGAGMGVETLNLFLERHYILGTITAVISIGGFFLGGYNSGKAEKRIDTLNEITLDYLEHNNYHINVIEYNHDIYKRSSEQLKINNWWDQYLVGSKNNKKDDPLN